MAPSGFGRVLPEAYDYKDEVEKHFSDYNVSRFVDINEKAEDIISFHLNDSGCRWGIFLKKSDTFIGTCGFHCWNKDKNQAEIGFDLTKKYWGNDYMKEALISIINFGFVKMNLDKIVVIVDEDNNNSKRFIKKLNFVKSGDKINNNCFEYFINKRWIV